MSDKHRHHSEGMDFNPRGVVSFRDFVEKYAREKGGSAVPSAPTFPAPCLTQLLLLLCSTFACRGQKNSLLDGTPFRTSTEEGPKHGGLPLLFSPQLCVA